MNNTKPFFPIKKKDVEILSKKTEKEKQMPALVKIENVDGKLTVSSRVVAEALGKEHKRILQDCREKLLEGVEFVPSSYVSEQNKEISEYLLTKDGFILLCMNYQGYNDFKRAYIAEFNRMEEELKNKNPLPKTYKESLIALVAEIEKNEQLALELDTTKTALNMAEEWFTVMKYNQVYGMQWDMTKCQKIGKAMSKFCRSNDYEIRKCKTGDDRFRQVNSYHISSWNEYLDF